MSGIVSKSSTQLTSHATEVSPTYPAEDTVVFFFSDVAWVVIEEGESSTRRRARSGLDLPFLALRRSQAGTLPSQTCLKTSLTEELAASRAQTPKIMTLQGQQSLMEVLPHLLL